MAVKISKNQRNEIQIATGSHMYFCDGVELDPYQEDIYIYAWHKGEIVGMIEYVCPRDIVIEKEHFTAECTNTGTLMYRIRDE